MITQMSNLKTKLIVLLISIFLFHFCGKSYAFASVNISVDSMPSSVTIGQEFTVSITANNLTNGTSYYLKGRIGIGSDLDKAETNNSSNSSPDNWLTDNDSWNKFPLISMGDNSSTWSGILKLRTRSTATVGQNSLKVRIKKTTTDTTYDSEAYNINLLAAPTPTPTLTPVPTSVPTSSPSNTPIPVSTPLNTPALSPKPTSISPTRKPTIAPVVYGDDYDENAKMEVKNNVLGESINPSVEPTPQEMNHKNESKETSLPVLFILIIGGVFCIVLSIILSMKEIRKKSRIFY